MSSSTEQAFNNEKVVLRFELNSILLLAFGTGRLHYCVCRIYSTTNTDLLGLYTMVYIGTMFLYRKYFFDSVYRSNFLIVNFLVVQKVNRNWAIMGALTALFGITVGQLGLQWQLLQNSFVDNGNMGNSIYISFLSAFANAFETKILAYCGNILADGILVSFNV